MGVGLNRRIAATPTPVKIASFPANVVGRSLHDKPKITAVTDIARIAPSAAFLSNSASRRTVGARWLATRRPRVYAIAVTRVVANGS
jgi:hypothetical protein